MPTVSVEAVSGYAGHAFVYARVHAGASSYPAPTGTHLSPYYAQWVAEPLAGANCPWVWAVYVFDRATNTQINPSPANAASRNFGTTTTICASPGSTPVDTPPMNDASARLDLDLSVHVTPPVASAGSPSQLAAVLSSALNRDLNLYMNLAIEDWRVSTWFFDFGDGQAATRTDNTRSIDVAHTYQTAGQYDARAIASISGNAQAAVYDRYGNPLLLEQGFALQIGNDVVANARARSVRHYLGPTVELRVTPSLDGVAPDRSVDGFRQVDAVRGRLTALAVHLGVVREADVTVDGRFAGFGVSHLTGWRLDGNASDAPAGTGTAPGTVHAASDSLLLQWNSPGQLQRLQPEPYVVPLTLFVQSRFPDGHIANYAISSSFLVSVNFPAESG